VTDYLLLVIGFPFLIGGATLLVKGASSLALRLGVSELVVGLTIVSMGTSAPELVVSMFSAFQGATDLAVGNVIGSNIANLLLILGASAVLRPLVLERNIIWREIPFGLLATLVLAVLANDQLLGGAKGSSIDRGDGLALLGFFAVFLYYLASVPRTVDERSSHPVGIAMAVVLVTGGIIGLVLGGQWIVQGAVATASALGMSEALIALTIIAVGTSLPELATSLVAAYQGKADMAIGNVVGSHVFNVLWILGFTATITPISFNPILNSDLGFLVVVTLLLMLLAFFGKRFRFGRKGGVAFLLLYAGYLISIGLRG
jgi:cation:H+ antiporter